MPAVHHAQLVQNHCSPGQAREPATRNIARIKLLIDSGLYYMYIYIHNTDLPSTNMDYDIVGLDAMANILFTFIYQLTDWCQETLLW